MKTFTDLFCGIGGFHYAAADLGLQCVFASDFDARCQVQYQHCHGIEVKGDLVEIKSSDVPEHDILFAGFPCQPFSIIGKRDGMKDRRGVVFNEIVRILKYRKPAAFLLENVRQLVSHNAGATFEFMLADLTNIGYDVQYRILNALDYGLPHKRERVLVVGLKNGLNHFKWPKPVKEYKPLNEILEANPDSKYFVSDRIRESRMAAHKSQHEPGIWHENKGGNISSHPFSCALRAGASYNYLLVDGVRRFTPREMLRLQGFPDCFDIVVSDCEIRKQTGNAVPVPMVRAVIREMLQCEK